MSKFRQLIRLIAQPADGTLAPVLMLVTGVATASLVVGGMGFLNPIENDVDAQADWLVANALVDGINPYTGVDELADVYGVPYRFARPPGLVGDASHPRTPGALLASLPLVFVDYMNLQRVTGLGAIAVVALAVYQSSRPYLFPLAIGVLVHLVLVSRPALWSLRFGSQAAVLALCGAITLRAIERDDAPAGVALGVAATLKAFPMLLIFPLLFARRRRAALASVVTVLVLNGAGLAFPNVRFGDAVTALTRASEAWFQLETNMSLPRLVASLTGSSSTVAIIVVSLPALGLLGFGLWKFSLPLSNQLLATASLAVLISPLSWQAYMLFIVPFAIHVIGDVRPVWRWIMGGALLALIAPNSMPSALETGILFVFLGTAFLAADPRVRSRSPEPLVS